MTWNLSSWSCKFSRLVRMFPTSSNEDNMVDLDSWMASEMNVFRLELQQDFHGLIGRIPAVDARFLEWLQDPWCL